MSEQDAADGSYVMDRIGAALDRITGAGYDEVHDAVAQNARHRMSVIKREHYPATKARRLIYLAEQCERLADELERLEAKDKEAKERRVEIGYVGDGD